MMPPRPKSKIMLSDSTNGGDTTGSMLTILNIRRTTRRRMLTYTST